MSKSGSPKGAVLRKLAKSLFRQAADITPAGHFSTQLLDSLDDIPPASVVERHNKVGSVALRCFGHRVVNSFLNIRTATRQNHRWCERERRAG